MALESCLIPLPSEVVMPLAGAFLVSGTAQMLGTSASLPLWVNLVIVSLAGSIGSVIGSIAAYWIGHAGGRPLVLKYGRFILISQHDTDIADRFFERWGSPTAFFSRMLPVVRTYISLPAGITRMPFGKFCLYTFLGSFPWCLLLAYLGTILGSNFDKLSPYFHDFDYLIIAIVIILVALYIWRHVRQDRNARAAQEQGGTGNSPAASQSQNGWNQQQQQGWDQQSSQPASQGWNQSQRPPQSPQEWNQPIPTPPPGWGQPQPQLPQQQGWNQQNPQQVQQSWGQPQPQQPPQQNWHQQPPQSSVPQQQGWGQQSQFPPQQNWGQPGQPGQSEQPPVPPKGWSQQFQQPPRSSQNGHDGSIRRD